MSQIFISHSAKDTESINFFNTMFSTLKVSGIYEEYDQKEGVFVNNQKIKNDLFILLSYGVPRNRPEVIKRDNGRGILWVRV